MAASLKERLLEALGDSKLLTDEQLTEAVAAQKAQGGNLGAILLKKGFIKEKDLAVLLSSSLNLPMLNLSRFSINPDVVKLIPEKTAKQYHVIPISIMGDNLTLCMSDPLNIFAIDDIKVLTNYNIDPVISTEKEIADAIHNYYGAESTQLAQILQEVKEADENEPLEVANTEEEGVVDIQEATKQSKVAPIVKVVNLMVAEALESRASDIHVEPQEKNLRIRYRVDGALQEAFSLPKKDQNAIITRLKIMSGLDITEWRIPQDGRFRIRMREKEVDFRVSILPTNHGGKVVMRALDKSSLSIGLDKLGYLPQPLKLFEQAITKPYGMILVTGPTGSGKSTTLYSIITQLNTNEKNIVTIEDPVEYQVDGITQIQVNPSIEFTFSTGLRSILRQTPDIVLIGEIRDFETADIAIKASLTGQLLFSTLHTNDACGAITRLMDMGVEPFLVASSLVAVAAQRLCRKICENCKEPYEITPAVLKRLNIKTSKDATFYHGKGCSKCSNTGYHGRMGTLEVLLIDDAIRDLIIKGKSSDEIKEYAVANGMKTLRENAFKKALSGLTTIEEVLRITTEE
ncbi:MAG: ATPase, T2SS/T4P/T4SS family [Candidatus Orphnella occulta]|nr:ATPase, T2SS/T4P/T4SS family [Candidatus Orphnella occulta]